MIVDLAVHVVAIAAVIGYVEYRLRSYAALMAHQSASEERQSKLMGELKQALGQILSNSLNIFKKAALTSPMFTCYYCKQEFPKAVRERIADNVR